MAEKLNPQYELITDEALSIACKMCDYESYYLDICIFKLF